MLLFYTILTNWVTSFPVSPAIYDMVEEKQETEPDFQYIPEKCPQDPSQLDQDAWRDSMNTLKEGLVSGEVLAQFDVSQSSPHLLYKFKAFMSKTITSIPLNVLVILFVVPRVMWVLFIFLLSFLR